MVSTWQAGPSIASLPSSSRGAELSGCPWHLTPATQLHDCALLQMPDWHPGVWQTNQELVNSALWIKNWVGLVNDMINLPNTAGKLILDLLNVSLGMYVWKRI